MQKLQDQAATAHDDYRTYYIFMYCIEHFFLQSLFKERSHPTQEPSYSVEGGDKGALCDLGILVIEAKVTRYHVLCIVVCTGSSTIDEPSTIPCFDK